MTRLERGVAIAILVAILVVGVVVTAGRSPEAGETEVFANRTSYSLAAGGTRALFDALQACGRPARRWRSPLGTLPQSAAALLILAPSAEPDWDDVVDFVTRGHLAVVAVDGSADRLGPRDAKDCELLPWGPGAGLKTLKCYGAERLENGQVWTELGFKSAWLQQAVPLAGDDHGTTVAWLPMGQGAFLLLHSAWPLSNHGLKQEAQGALLVLNALEVVGAQGDVLFDEYDHGYREETSLWDVMPGPTRGGVIQLLLVLLVGILAASVRARPPLRPEDARARSRAEYLAALAGLMHRAGLRQVAVQQVLSELPAEWSTPEQAAEAGRLKAAPAPDDVRALAIIQKARALLKARPSGGDVGSGPA
ncbi:MAG TPA: DUF4350 domain-containing protein [Candidatus Xenobia bacterium]|jgi:hypothetical protein